MADLIAVMLEREVVEGYAALRPPSNFPVGPVTVTIAAAKTDQTTTEDEK